MAKAPRKVIISCAVTGSIHTPSMSDHLPLTPDEIVANAVDAARAGAAVFQLHARNPEDGSPTADPSVFNMIVPPGPPTSHDLTAPHQAIRWTMGPARSRARLSCSLQMHRRAKRRGHKRQLLLSPEVARPRHLVNLSARLTPTSTPSRLLRNRASAHGPISLTLSLQTTFADAAGPYAFPRPGHGCVRLRAKLVIHQSMGSIRKFMIAE